MEFSGNVTRKFGVGIASENHQFGHDSILLSIGV
jgi:hypothetical protein